MLKEEDFLLADKVVPESVELTILAEILHHRVSEILIALFSKSSHASEGSTA